MFQRGFSNAGGFGRGESSADGEFERLTRQYWEAWGQTLRAAMSPAAPPPSPMEAGIRAWQDAVQRWNGPLAGTSVLEQTLGRFGQQAGQWYAQMQQVAAQLAGHPNRPADVVAAWKTALGDSANTLFLDLMDSMGGQGMQGMEQWLRSVQPFLEVFKGNALWLNLPAVGFTREHQERLKDLAQAQWQVQQAGQAYNALMLAASKSAFEYFEQRLEQHADNGQQPIQTPRALFDVWVDAAEQAYAEVALSKDYRCAYADLANAQMRLRAGIQREVEQLCAHLGMPTRSELDGAHRKIIELERALRRLLRERDAADFEVSEQHPVSAVGKKPAQTRAVNTTTAKSAINKAARPVVGKKVRKKIVVSPVSGKESTP